MTRMTDERLAEFPVYEDVIGYVSRKFDEDGTGELGQFRTPIENLLWQLLNKTNALRAELAAKETEIARLTTMVDSAINYANCRINGHSNSCNREMWHAMVRRLGDGVAELPDDETYEHPEPAP